MSATAGRRHSRVFLVQTGRVSRKSRWAAEVCDLGTSCRAVQPHDEWHVIDFPGCVSAWIVAREPPSQMLVMFSYCALLLGQAIFAGYFLLTLRNCGVKEPCSAYTFLWGFSWVFGHLFSTWLTVTRAAFIGPSVQRSRISEAKNLKNTASR